MKTSRYECIEGGNIQDGPGIKGRKIGEAEVGSIFLAPAPSVLAQGAPWSERGWIQLCTAQGAPRDVWLEYKTLQLVDELELPSLPPGTYNVSGTLTITPK